jgi:hypothetical protein
MTAPRHADYRPAPPGRRAQPAEESGRRIANPPASATKASIYVVLPPSSQPQPSPVCGTVAGEGGGPHFSTRLSWPLLEGRAGWHAAAAGSGSPGGGRDSHHLWPAWPPALPFPLLSTAVRAASAVAAGLQLPSSDRTFPQNHLRPLRPPPLSRMLAWRSGRHRDPCLFSG